MGCEGVAEEEERNDIGGYHVSCIAFLFSLHIIYNLFSNSSFLGFTRFVQFYFKRSSPNWLAPSVDQCSWVQKWLNNMLSALSECFKFYISLCSYSSMLLDNLSKYILFKVIFCYSRFIHCACRVVQFLVY